MLDLQSVDSTLGQHAHRLNNLPEHAIVAELKERQTDLMTRHGQAQTSVEDLAREQRKADADVEQVKARRTRDAERVQGGMVSDPKQLQAMQHEIELLDERISDLEDAELDVMQRMEDAQTHVDEIASELAEVEQSLSHNESVRDEQTAEINTLQQQAQTERDQIAAEIPEDLLALYNRLRGQLGGVGAGALRHKQCEGCRLDVTAADLARYAAAPPEEVLRCEECNRILVRTADSGI